MSTPNDYPFYEASDPEGLATEESLEAIVSDVHAIIDLVQTGDTVSGMSVKHVDDSGLDAMSFDRNRRIVIDESLKTADDEATMTIVVKAPSGNGVFTEDVYTIGVDSAMHCRTEFENIHGRNTVLDAGAKQPMTEAAVEKLRTEHLASLIEAATQAAVVRMDASVDRLANKDVGRSRLQQVAATLGKWLVPKDDRDN